ncbi:hypothetical protein [Lichenihabitans psoromatis]|uniref:hypothetical protein n=1 Tax=Lichenihabitans psoromatis TaxID=2528642 RepID=UPI001038366B|nr:hypothetical protein [Lichenihabitans psoromatis]
MSLRRPNAFTTVRTIAALCLIAVPIQARAEVPPNGVAAMTTAYAAMDARARQTRAKGTLPRWSVVSDRAVLEQVWNSPAILGTPPYTAKDVPLLIGIGEQQSAIYKTYVLFSSNPTTLPDMAQNSTLFQDEITRASIMTTMTLAAEAEAIGDFIVHLPPDQMTDVRRQGLKGFRLGMLELISGFTIMLRSPSLTTDNRALLIDSLAAEAPALAAAAPRGDRSAFVATVNTVIPSLPPDLQSKMAVFVKAMSTDPCERLCAIP